MEAATPDVWTDLNPLLPFSVPGPFLEMFKIQEGGSLLSIPRRRSGRTTPNSTRCDTFNSDIDRITRPLLSKQKITFAKIKFKILGIQGQNLL